MDMAYQIQPICNYPGCDVGPTTAAPAYLAAIHVPGNGSVSRVPSFCGVSSVPTFGGVSRVPTISGQGDDKGRRWCTWGGVERRGAGSCRRPGWPCAGGAAGARARPGIGGAMEAEGCWALAEERGWPGRSDDNARCSAPSSAARFCRRPLRPSHSTSGGIEGSGGGAEERWRREIPQVQEGIGGVRSWTAGSWGGRSELVGLRSQADRGRTFIISR